ncbi:MAG TPA: sigma-70 family RNA polymerase sigma factor [Gemmatimonadales bacterium]
MAELRRGRAEAAWDLFLDRYRRLIFAAIRHYAQDYDDVMDVFARVCESLRESDLKRLRSYFDQPSHSARFSTWLVTVVRHLTVDSFRHRDGRRRLSTVAAELAPLRSRIFEFLFINKRSHVESYELLKSSDGCDLTFGQFLAEVSATYRAVTGGRRGRILRELGGPVPPIDDIEDEQASANERRDELDEALSCLSPEERVAVELYVVEEMPADAVAKVVGWHQHDGRRHHGAGESRRSAVTGPTHQKHAEQPAARCPSYATSPARLAKVRLP